MIFLSNSIIIIRVKFFFDTYTSFSTFFLSFFTAKTTRGNQCYKDIKKDDPTYNTYISCFALQKFKHFGFARRYLPNSSVINITKNVISS